MSVFGFSTESNGGGDFLPIVKFDARAGKMFRRDRVDIGGQFSNEDIDITQDFRAVMDLETLETGWINFNTGGAPNFAVVPMGEPLPNRPTGDHKNGVRLMLKLNKTCGGDKPIREIASTARTFLSGLEQLYLTYQEQRADHRGELPIVALKDTKPVKAGQPPKQSTNYQPVFEIVGWAPRGDLVFQPKALDDKHRPSANTPPATGSTVVAPPQAKQLEPIESVGIGDDFG